MVSIVYSALRTLRLKTRLKVPTSSDRMLQKSLQTKSDVVIYDLEDSVPPARADKDNARQRLVDFLSVRELAVCVKADLIQTATRRPRDSQNRSALQCD